MSLKNPLRHIGMLTIAAMLAVAATPALAVDDASSPPAKTHKKMSAKHKATSQKSREDSMMNKDTTPAYPPQTTNGGGY